MATLRIKNLPDALYEQLKRRALKQRRSVAQEVTQILAERLAESELRAIHALKGLGKERWQDVEAAAYVENERRAWD